MILPICIWNYFFPSKSCEARRPQSIEIIFTSTQKVEKNLFYFFPYIFLVVFLSFFSLFCHQMVSYFENADLINESVQYFPWSLTFVTRILNSFLFFSLWKGEWRSERTQFVNFCQLRKFAFYKYVCNEKLKCSIKLMSPAIKLMSPVVAVYLTMNLKLMGTRIKGGWERLKKKK